MNDHDDKHTDPERFREQLSTEEYSVMFEHGTERPGSSPLLAEERRGTYHCAACGAELFHSGTKFESGSG
ncbi:MAG TPA: peptide-methionine (R)-S-oxide reductase, partial [Deinococcales bacterium]|nr:peptide-methionine (R)-S-oxide reductase [Deinococcales bacterium]